MVVGYLASLLSLILIRGYCRVRDERYAAVTEAAGCRERKEIPKPREETRKRTRRPILIINDWPRVDAVSRRERTSSAAATTGRDSGQDDPPAGQTDPLRESSTARYLILGPRDSSWIRTSQRDKNPAANLISLISTSWNRSFPRGNRQTEL